jgi:hypothetical protein
MTESKKQRFLFQELDGRKVEVAFSGRHLSSNGGRLILSELDAHSDLLRNFADWFIDYRDQHFVEHSMMDLVAQRIHGLALGYEDPMITTSCGRDPLHALICSKCDPLGQDRLLECDKSQSTGGSLHDQSF